MTSNARLIADLQAVQIGIHLVGLDRLPEVMVNGQAPTNSVGISRSEMNPEQPQEPV